MTGKESGSWERSDARYTPTMARVKLSARESRVVNITAIEPAP